MTATSTAARRTGLLVRLAAELGVIVVGVLIALWADGWVAQRAERRIEESRIEALRDNVRGSRVRLEDADEEARRAQGALAALARDPARAARDQDLVLVGLLFGPGFTPEMNVYADLKSSGDLALMTNARLRQALARMDALFEQLYLLQDDLNAVQQLSFDPFVLREFALAGSLGPFLGLDDLPADPWTPQVDPRLLRNLALFKLDLVTQLVAAHARVAEALDEVEAAMGDAP